MLEQFFEAQKKERQRAKDNNGSCCKILEGGLHTILHSFTFGKKISRDTGNKC